MQYRFDGKSPDIEDGAYISELAMLIGDVKIAKDCYIGHGVILRGDYGRIEINAGTAVEEGVIVHAPPREICHIGQKVTIGHGAVVHSALIGDFAVIGMGAILSMRSEVGESSIVAEGAIVRVKQCLPARVVVAGNPARIVREIEKKDLEHWSYGKQLYIDLARKYLAQGMERL
ncbi:MAG: gamma carbonic anhydrase family protein [Pseudomonadota bacterium]